MRLVLAIIVGLLTFSASGMSAFVVNEPCTGYEQPDRDDRGCPPTCVTCGCCAQAAEPAMLQVAATPDDRIAEAGSPAPPIPETRPRDILHVPKRRIA